MNARFATLLLPIVAAGCASGPQVTVNDDVATGWRGKTVILTERPRADFVPMSAGHAAFAMLGAVVAIQQGKQLVAENGIEDPAPHIARDLLELAKLQRGLLPSDLPPAKLNTTDVAQIASAGAGADLVLDVEPLEGGFHYFAMDWTHYWVRSGFVIRIVDVKTSAVVAGATCRRDSRDDPKPPTNDELMANRAERLKQVLASQRDACRDEFATTVLRIAPRKI